MPKYRYIIASISLLAAAIIISFLSLYDTPATGPEESMASSSPTLPPDSEAGMNVRRPIETSTPTTAITRNQIELTLEEISTRFELDQSEEALNELNGLLNRYDDMTHTEKRDLLDAYATYFRKNSLYGDAIFFYEEILKLPELEHSNRLALLQLLGIIAMQAEDWNGFLSYYDRFFEVGGEINWVMTRSLTSAYQRLENHDAAGDSMLLHIQTGIHPQYDGSDEQYERRYSVYESIPLNMTNNDAALTLAQEMVERFDKPGNWRVLSELYQRLNDNQNFSDTLAIAQERGYIDSSGNWMN